MAYSRNNMHAYILLNDICNKLLWDMKAEDPNAVLLELQSRTIVINRQRVINAQEGSPNKQRGRNTGPKPMNTGKNTQNCSSILNKTLQGMNDRTGFI